MEILLKIDIGNSITLTPLTVSQIKIYEPRLDLVSVYILRSIGKFTDLCPLLTTPDGSCLFNSISVLLSGSERLTVELRLRAFKYLAENFVELNLLKHTEDSAIICSPNVLETMKSAVKTDGWGSHFTIKALANVIGAQIAVLYPAVRPNDLSKILTKIYNPKISITSN